MNLFFEFFWWFLFLSFYFYLFFLPEKKCNIKKMITKEKIIVISNASVIDEV